MNPPPLCLVFFSFLCLLQSPPPHHPSRPSQSALSSLPCFMVLHSSSFFPLPTQSLLGYLFHAHMGPRCYTCCQNMPPSCCSCLYLHTDFLAPPVLPSPSPFLAQRPTHAHSCWPSSPVPTESKFRILLAPPSSHPLPPPANVATADNCNACIAACAHPCVFARHNGSTRPWRRARKCGSLHHATSESLRTRHGGRTTHGASAAACLV